MCCTQNLSKARALLATFASHARDNELCLRKQNDKMGSGHFSRKI
jgi:hypothetical protein